MKKFFYYRFENSKLTNMILVLDLPKDKHTMDNLSKIKEQLSEWISNNQKSRAIFIGFGNGIRDLNENFKLDPATIVIDIKCEELL